jgi:hypothetical protein
MWVLSVGGVGRDGDPAPVRIVSERVCVPPSLLGRLGFAQVTRTLVHVHRVHVHDPTALLVVDRDDERPLDLGGIARTGDGWRLHVRYQTESQKKTFKRPAESTSKMRMYQSTRVIRSCATTETREP